MKKLRNLGSSMKRALFILLFLFTLLPKFGGTKSEYFRKKCLDIPDVRAEKPRKLTDRLKNLLQGLGRHTLYYPGMVPSAPAKTDAKIVRHTKNFFYLGFDMALLINKCELLTSLHYVTCICFYDYPTLYSYIFFNKKLTLPFQVFFGGGPGRTFFHNVRLTSNME
jgi:hypothetical protein